MSSFVCEAVTSYKTIFDIDPSCSDADFEALLSCPNLEILKVSADCVTSTIIGSFPSNLVNLRILRISLHGERFSKDDIRTLLTGCKLLKSLSLVYSGGIDDSTLEAVAELTQLNDLTLFIQDDQSTVTGHGFTQILCSCVSLERVAFYFGTRWGNNGLQNFRSVHAITLDQLNLISFQSNQTILSSATVKMLMRRFPTLRTCIQNQLMYVQSDTRVSELAPILSDEKIAFENIIFV